MSTPSRRAKFYADVPDEKWSDWRWQMSNRLNTVAELANVLDLSESERKALEAKNLFRVDITPYFARSLTPTIRMIPFANRSSPPSAKWCRSPR